MFDTFTLTLSGNSSILETQYFPPIRLSENKRYYLSLVSFITFNSIPNVDEDINNKVYIIDGETITIPTGSYEIDDIANFLKDYSIQLWSGNNTLRSYIKSPNHIDFRASDSIASLLGFTPRILEANHVHESDLPVNIIGINALRIECNITTGAYVNNKKVHTIHSFFPSTPPGYKIIEVPTNPIYLPVIVKTIDHLQIKVVDQDGRLVNFRGETITVRLHIKSE